MLNLSENNIHKRFSYEKFSAFKKISFLSWEGIFDDSLSGSKTSIRAYHYCWKIGEMVCERR